MAFSAKRRIGVKRRLKQAIGFRGLGSLLPSRPSVGSIAKRALVSNYLKKEPVRYRVIDTADKQFKTKILYEVYGRTSKAFLKAWADVIYYSIPITGSGFTFKKTKVTTGRVAVALGRVATKDARVKLRGRRLGTAQADQVRAIKTAHAKIDRLKTERLEYLAKSGRPTLRIALGSYYRRWIAPKYDSARRTIGEIIAERLRRLK